jgi:hypothetical protein
MGSEVEGNNMNEMEERAIKETEERAKELLFDKGGKKKGEDDLITGYVCQYLLRKATIDEVRRGDVFDWAGTTYTYDAGYGRTFLRAGGSFYARVLCCAAAIMLKATGGISDPLLRNYVMGHLLGQMPVKGRRGHSKADKDAEYRDVIIAGALIPPLLDRFNATRNEATEGTESACSIVQQALENLRIHMAEATVVRAWKRVPPSVRTKMISVGSK